MVKSLKLSLRRPSPPIIIIIREVKIREILVIILVIVILEVLIVLERVLILAALVEAVPVSPPLIRTRLLNYLMKVAISFIKNAVILNVIV